MSETRLHFWTNLLASLALALAIGFGGWSSAAILDLQKRTAKNEQTNAVVLTTLREMQRANVETRSDIRARLDRIENRLEALHQ